LTYAVRLKPRTIFIHCPYDPFRVLKLTLDGVHQCGGGYTDHVVRTGHEAPSCGVEVVRSGAALPLDILPEAETL
jgi:hypothetical protein